MTHSDSASYGNAVYTAAVELTSRGRKVFAISSNKIPYANCEDCKGNSSAAHRDTCPCMADPFARCHGFWAATSDPEVIKAWLVETPDMQLAVATGRTSGIFVFDCDSRNGGDVSYQELVDEFEPFDTETNTTPGGQHFIFELPNFDVHANSGKIWPGIDIKGEGGYHLVPPSPGYVTEDTQQARQAPKWLRDAIFSYQAKFKWSEGSRNLSPVERKDFDPAAITDNMSDAVAKTVSYWTGKIRSAPDGHQNVYIYTAARVLFSLCYHGLLDDDDATGLLEAACVAGNHPRDRTLFAIDSGRRAAEDNPDPVDDALSDDRDILETFQLDDIGNANRVVFWKGMDIRYDPDRERFYTFDKKKWIPSREGRILGLVEDVITKISATEALFYSDNTCPVSELNKSKSTPKTYRQVFLEWAAKQRFAGKITATSLMLKGRSALWCIGDDFDIDPYKLNVANGIVDLRTGALHPHNRAEMCSNVIDVPYDPTATCPEWDRFLEMTQPNEEHRKYIQRLMGLTMIGEVRDQIFALHIGSGGNGKGVFLDCCAHVMGEYATTGQRDSFVRKTNSNRIPADIASFEGKRIVIVDELNDNQKMDTALLKDVTGGGKIKAESKNVNPWEYTPKFTLHFRTNHMPDLPSDRSIVRRFRPVRWSVEPTSDQWDTFTSPHHSTPFNYLTKRESSGILNWILEGTRDYLENGLQVPIDLQLDAVMMLEEQDPFLMFMNECIEHSPGNTKDGTQLYKAFRDWYDDHYSVGRPPSSKSLWVDVREGKYKGRWPWDVERGRMVFRDIQVTNMLGVR